MKLLDKRIISDWAYQECVKGNDSPELRKLIITKYGISSESIFYDYYKFKQYIDLKLRKCYDKKIKRITVEFFLYLNHVKPKYYDGHLNNIAGFLCFIPLESFYEGLKIFENIKGKEIRMYYGDMHFKMLNIRHDYCKKYHDLQIFTNGIKYAINNIK